MTLVDLNTHPDYPEIATLDLGDFNARFAAAIGPLFRAVGSDEIRYHPIWGPLIPYDIASYSRHLSAGHIVRPDIVLTTAGPRITEIDTVPSGRGWSLLPLPLRLQADMCRSYAAWYTRLGFENVFYAHGTTTSCGPEAQYWAQMMRTHTGMNITAGNIDEVDSVPDGTLVDRLFYSSELARTFEHFGAQVITAEPYLDSKIIFALVHDPDMTDTLTRLIGRENLDFLREVLIKTYMLGDVVTNPEKFGLNLITDVIGDGARNTRQFWVIKSGEVENDWSWGSRSVVLGGRFSRKVWEDAVRGFGNPKNKIIGKLPVLQQYAASLDFRQWWDAAAHGQIAMAYPPFLGKGHDPNIYEQAVEKTQVFARIGIFFLLDRTGATTLPAGMATLRQDPLAHGAKDAQFLSFI